MKRSIHIVCQFDGSLNYIIEKLIPYLKDDFVVTREGELEPMFRDILLIHHLHPEIIKDETFNSFKKKILIQPLDGTDIKKEFIELFNKFDLIITPSSAGKRILKENGIKTKIEIIGNFYTEDLKTKTNIDLSQSIPELKETPFVFYHESTLNKRKGFKELCYSYLDAFSNTENANKVLLIIKGLESNHPYNKEIEKDKEEVFLRQQYYKNPAKIVKISQHLPEDKLNTLLQQSDCYVQLSQIEGFGIPLLKAAALGKPIITLDNRDCGYMDFLNEDNCYLVNSCKMTKEHGFWLYDKNSLWTVPYLAAASKTFQRVLFDYHHISLKNKYDVTAFELNNIAKQYLKILNEI